MWLVSTSCYSLGTEYYHVYRSEGFNPHALPRIMIIFMTRSGWIYYYPAIFVVTALFLLGKCEQKQSGFGLLAPS